MKKTIYLFFCVALLSACNNNTNEVEQETETANQEIKTDYQYYGDSINADGAIEASKLMAMVEKNDSVAVKVVGKINSSCEKKGCWMKMDIGNNKEMYVKFKDYEFFVPKNLNGEIAIIDGYATIDTIDVDQLRHLAEDAGKSEEEIAAINEPEVALSYMAHGVLIK